MLKTLNKDIKRIENQNKTLNKENHKLKNIIRDKDQIIRNLVSKSKLSEESKGTKSTRKDDSKQDLSTSNDELLYYIYDILSKVPESKSYDVMYKYITDVMKYLLKVETWIILK